MRGIEPRTSRMQRKMWKTFSLAFSEKNQKELESGDAGYRTPYLSHAKRALYHVSYIPQLSDKLNFYFNIGI